MGRSLGSLQFAVLRELALGPRGTPYLRRKLVKCPTQIARALQSLERRGLVRIELTGTGRRLAWLT